jgi:hypothetical protein
MHPQKDPARLSPFGRPNCAASGLMLKNALDRADQASCNWLE